MSYISSKNMKRVIRFIPILSDLRPNLPPWLLSSKQTWLPERKAIEDFLSCLCSEGLILNKSWQSCYQTLANAVDEGPLLPTLGKVNELTTLFTFHYRFEQFRKGHIIEQLNSGHLLSLLKRLQLIESSSQDKIVWLNPQSLNQETRQANFFS